MALLDRTSDELDPVFDSLGHSVRRRILGLLVEATPRTGVKLTRDGSGIAADGSQRTVDDHHVHLPKLDEAGYVRWDRDVGLIDRGPRFDAVAPVVRLLADHQDEPSGEWP